MKNFPTQFYKSGAVIATVLLLFHTTLRADNVVVDPDLPLAVRFARS